MSQPVTGEEIPTRWCTWSVSCQVV